MKKALKKAFIPHEDNNFRPHVLRAKTLVPVVIAIIVVQMIVSWGISSVIPKSELFGIIETNALTDGTNAARLANNVPALAMSPLLQAAAQEKANDMAAKGYFAHTSPAGITPWYWFANVGYSFSYAGENLAVNFSDSQDVTNAWMNSPEHRANILDTNYTQIGIATAQGTYNGEPATYVVELFGTPTAEAAIAANNAEAQHPIAQINPALGKGTSVASNPVAVAKPAATPIVNGVQQQAVVPVNPATGTEPISVAVKGIQTTGQQVENAPAQNNIQNQPVATETPMVAPPVVTAATAPTTQEVKQSNFIQRAFANPNRSLNDIYYLVLLFFAVALGLNVFVKIRVQHPDLILGGLVAISLVGIFIVANQQSVLNVIIK